MPGGENLGRPNQKGHATRRRKRGVHGSTRPGGQFRTLPLNQQVGTFWDGEFSVPIGWLYRMSTSGGNDTGP